MQANPRLQALAVLIGEWTTVGAHPMLPGKTFHGRATFTWLESGAFLLFQSRIDEPEIPDGVAILGFGLDQPSLGGSGRLMRIFCSVATTRHAVDSSTLSVWNTVDTRSNNALRPGLERRTRRRPA